MLPEDIIRNYQKGYSIDQIVKIIERSCFDYKTKRSTYNRKEIKEFVYKVVYDYVKSRL